MMSQSLVLASLDQYVRKRITTIMMAVHPFPRSLQSLSMTQIPYFPERRGRIWKTPGPDSLFESNSLDDFCLEEMLKDSDSVAGGFRNLWGKAEQFVSVAFPENPKRSLTELLAASKESLKSDLRVMQSAAAQDVTSRTGQSDRNVQDLTVRALFLQPSSGQMIRVWRQKEADAIAKAAVPEGPVVVRMEVLVGKAGRIKCLVELNCSTSSYEFPVIMRNGSVSATYNVNLKHKLILPRKVKINFTVSHKDIVLANGSFILTERAANTAPVPSSPRTVDSTDVAMNSTTPPPQKTNARSSPVDLPRIATNPVFPSVTPFSRPRPESATRQSMDPFLMTAKYKIGEDDFHTLHEGDKVVTNPGAVVLLELELKTAGLNYTLNLFTPNLAYALGNHVVQKRPNKSIVLTQEMFIHRGAVIGEHACVLTLGDPSGRSHELHFTLKLVRQE